MMFSVRLATILLVVVVSAFSNKQECLKQTALKEVEMLIPKVNQKHNKRIQQWASSKLLNSTKEQGQLDFFGRSWLTTILHNPLVENNFFSLEFKKNFKAIIPGTNFCGDGDVADNIMDLGYFRDLDTCCRNHDYCQDVMFPNKFKHGLHNTGLFTRLDCQCDGKFYNCLEKLNSILANKIGFTYFTVLGPQCYQNEYPIINCSEYSWGRCIKYKFDNSKEMRYQWFDNPTFFPFIQTPYKTISDQDDRRSGDRNNHSNANHAMKKHQEPWQNTIPKEIEMLIPRLSQKYNRRINEKARTKLLNSTEEQGQLDFFGRTWLGNIIRSPLVQNQYFGANFIQEFKLIFPGTNFCGDGDIADNVMDLGYFREVDTCCRNHDYCPDTILAGKIKHGLHNGGLFTRAHCKCDLKLYYCLQKVNSIVSNKIGFTYFSLLGPQCFQNDYPIVSCQKYSWGRCNKYKLDKTKRKRYQWFDNPTFFPFSNKPYGKKTRNKIVDRNTAGLLNTNEKNNETKKQKGKPTVKNSANHGKCLHYNLIIAIFIAHSLFFIVVKVLLIQSV